MKLKIFLGLCLYCCLLYNILPSKKIENRRQTVKVTRAIWLGDWCFYAIVEDHQGNIIDIPMTNRKPRVGELWTICEDEFEYDYLLKFKNKE